MEQTRNEDDSRRKKARDETPMKGGFKKQRQNFISKNWPQNFMIFLVQKYRYGDYEKRVKKKYEKRSRTKEREKKWGKTEEDTQKRRWRKKLRKHEIENREKEKHWDKK